MVKINSAIFERDTVAVFSANLSWLLRRERSCYTLSEMLGEFKEQGI